MLSRYWSQQEYQQRPSSSLSALTNTLEALFLPSIRQIYLLAEHEHEFRPQHSTTITFRSISTNMSVCNPRLIKGVWTANYATFIGVWKEDYPPAMLEMLGNELYIWRQSNVEFQNKKSKTRRLKQGVPQDEVISSKLFNLYLSRISRPPEGTEIVIYAYDGTIIALSTAVDITPNTYLAELALSSSRRISKYPLLPQRPHEWSAVMKTQVNV